MIDAFELWGCHFGACCRVCIYTWYSGYVPVKIGVLKRGSTMLKLVRIMLLVYCLMVRIGPPGDSYQQGYPEVPGARRRTWITKRSAIDFLLAALR